MKTMFMPLFAALFLAGCAGTPRKPCDGKTVVVPHKPCVEDVWEEPKIVERVVHIPAPKYVTRYVREPYCPPPIVDSGCPPRQPFRFVQRAPCPQPIQNNVCPPSGQIRFFRSEQHQEWRQWSSGPSPQGRQQFHPGGIVSDDGYTYRRLD